MFLKCLRSQSIHVLVNATLFELAPIVQCTLSGDKYLWCGSSTGDEAVFGFPETGHGIIPG